MFTVLLEYLHNKGFIHCDIKPDNIAIGLGSDHKLKVIDFGCAKFYWKSQRTREHIPFKTGKLGYRGTPRYVSFKILRLKFLLKYKQCSENVHLGHALSRRDDFISLAYTLAYLLRYPLPWQDALKNDNKSIHRLYQFDIIAGYKYKYTGRKLFEGFHPIFGDFMIVSVIN